MCIFNDLSGGNKYPSLIVHFNDGRERVIKNVSYFVTLDEGLRIMVSKRMTEIVLEDVAYATVTHYKYKVVNGRATIQ